MKKEIADWVWQAEVLGPLDDRSLSGVGGKPKPD